MWAVDQVFEGELVRLRRENAALRDQLQRALKELKFYQHRYPSAYAPGNREDEVYGEYIDVELEK